MKAGVTINRPPRDGIMAFVRSPDKHSIELLQKGDAAAAAGAVEIDAQYRQMVTRLKPAGSSACRPRQTLSIPRHVQRPSSSGLGRRPFTAVTRVRIP